MQHTGDGRPRRFFLDQHGCAKNQVDAELIIHVLAEKGWERCDDAADAALIIVNSCGFIESAKTESINSLMDARAAYPDAKIILAGCLAERYAADFAENLPEADAVFGNGDIARITEVVGALFPSMAGFGADSRVAAGGSSARASGSDARVSGAAVANHDCHASATTVSAGSECVVVRPAQKGVSAGARDEFLNFPSSAYLKITEGCSNCCSFCAIPLIRGSLRSRSIPEIVAEFKELLSKGIFEVNLIGQDLAAFGRDGVTTGDSGNAAYFKEPSPLSELLRALSAVPGNFWVRLLYIHPDHFPLDILPVLKADPRILPYFDIPFQSGSTSIIKAMNRCGTAESYLALAEKLRSEVGAVVRTTFLCGFPGETEENAAETEAFLGSLQPDWSGCFAYSREEDTPAYSMKKQVPVTKAAKRAERLQELQSEITEERLKSRVGKTYDVLIEELIPTGAPVEGAGAASVSDSVRDSSEGGAAEALGAPVDDAGTRDAVETGAGACDAGVNAADSADCDEPGLALGRAWFQAPDVDGTCVIRYDLDDDKAVAAVRVGKVVTVKVLAVNGVDLDTVFLRSAGDMPAEGAAFGAVKSGAGAPSSEKSSRPECPANSFAAEN